MKVSELPIPEPLIAQLQARGYVELYPPQEHAIEAGVFQGRSMLLATPTASGKTLVAILAAAKSLSEHGGKVVYLTPLRALANEKFEELSMLGVVTKPGGERVKIAISTGDYDSSGESLGWADVMVLTNEKFDSVLRHGAGWIDSVRIFVADEVHLLGEARRGPTLEMIITKILHYAEKAQLLALSATVTNSKELASWAGAALLDVNWRPVPLIEGVYGHGEVHFSNGSVKKMPNTGRGAVLDVATDGIADGGQSLVFSETRRRAVALAAKASEISERYLVDDEKGKLGEVAAELLSAGEETDLSRSLADAVKRGSAFHHAGLDSAHRRIVENAFRAHLVKILVSTPTLAAGVNLPARRVVIGSLFRYDAEYGGQAPIDVLDYKQMAGRAGRPRFDSFGEIVIVPPAYADPGTIYTQYIDAEPEPIRSKLAEESSLRFHLLATIASLPGLTEEEIHSLLAKTLYGYQYRTSTVRRAISRSIKFLLDEGLVVYKGKRTMATDFGRRVSMLYIDPSTGVLFRRALEAAPKGVSHEAGLIHLLVSSPDFAPRLFLRGKDYEEATELLSQCKEEFLIPPPEESYGPLVDDFMQDFRSLLTIKAWMEEWSEQRILERLNVEPGDLHRAVENANWLVHAEREVARLVRREDLVREVDELSERVRHGVRKELVALVQLQGVGRVRGRALFQAGFADLGKLRSAPTERVASIPKIGMALAKRIKDQLAARDRLG